LASFFVLSNLKRQKTLDTLGDSNLQNMPQPTRILIVRFSSIGDIVLTTPIIRCLKNQLEGAVEIDFITKKQFTSLLTHNPHINQVISIEKSVSEVAQTLKHTHYDYILDLHNNLRSRAVKTYNKAFSFTLNKNNFAKWLYVQTKKELIPVRHVVARSFDTVKALSVYDDGEGLDFFFPPQDELNAAILPVKFNAGYVAYAIGGQMQGKILPTDKIIALCKKIKAPVVLLGGAEDRERGNEVKLALEAQVFNACGVFTLAQSALIAKQSKAIITHDTGMMHIATALGCKVISIWLATTPALGFAPWQPKNESIIIEADCNKRPTSKLGNRGYKSGCVFNVDLDKIADTTNEALLV
jgi:heptosyltransferase-2